MKKTNQGTETNKGFDYKLDLLKEELKTINLFIDKVDNICQTAKYWSLFLFVGTITVILGSKNHDINNLIFVAPIVPIIFWVMDATWRRHQNRAIYRSKKIASYLNSADFQDDVKNGKMDNFLIWDIVGLQYSESPEYKKFTSFWRMFMFKTIARFYFGLILLGIAIVIGSFIFII